MSSKPSAQTVSTPPGFLGQVRRHQRHNIFVFLTEALTSSFSWGFLETPAFAAYLLALGSSRLMIQGITSTYLFAWYVPMVLFVPLIERHKARVRQMFRYAIPTRLVMATVAASAWATAAWGPGIGLAGVWIGLGVLMLTGGGVHVCWQDLNSRVVVPASRGLYIGARLLVVTIGFVSTGLVVYAFVGPAGAGVAPLDFAWPFTIGALVYVFAVPLPLLLREPLPDGDPPAWRGYRAGLRRLFSILRDDPRFRRFLLVRALTCTIWLFSVPLMSAYAGEAFGIAKADIALWFTVAFFITHAMAAPLGGWIGDRIGHKRVHCMSLAIFCCVYLLAFSLPWWPPAMRFSGFLLILAFQGVAGSWYFLSQFNLVFEFADEHRRGSYIALSGLVIGVALLVCGVGGGWICTLLGYSRALLIAFGTVSVACLVALRYMPDPRREVHPPILLPGEKP